MRTCRRGEQANRHPLRLSRGAGEGRCTAQDGGWTHPSPEPPGSSGGGVCLLAIRHDSALRRKPRRGVWRHARRARCVLCVRPRRGVRVARRERCWQDQHPALHLRPGPGTQRWRGIRGPLVARHGPASGGTCWHRPRARGAARVSQPLGRGEPGRQLHLRPHAGQSGDRTRVDLSNFSRACASVTASSAVRCRVASSRCWRSVGR